ncbi:MAG TPA: fused MFS/spermidine synthase [bacterium]|nr:fused MFS/spermidine synthase [Candidatus Omnitrophota bacterium]HOJ60876.1 fused MFS/spermidine synthase [bacterium]
MIPFIVFLSGAVVMSFEMLGSKILAPHFGNTIFVWGSLIGIFLSGLTVGYWGGGRLADRVADLRCFAALLAIPGLLLCCFPLYCDPVNFWIFDKAFGPRMEPLLACLILFFPPTIFMGAVSPYAVKLQVKNLDWLGTGVGNLYALSSLGSIIGTLFTSFYLITWFGVRTIILIEGIILLTAAAFLCLAHAWGRRTSQRNEPISPTPVPSE